MYTSRELTLLRDCPAPDAIKKCIIVALKQSERVALEERKNMKKIKSFMKPTGASKLSKALKQLMDLCSNTKAISMVEHGLSLIIDSKMRPVLGENKTVEDVLKMKKKAYVKTYYFACGVSIHCQIGGQKIEIQVIEHQDGAMPMETTAIPSTTTTNDTSSSEEDDGEYHCMPAPKCLNNGTCTPCHEGDPGCPKEEFMCNCTEHYTGRTCACDNIEPEGDVTIDWAYRMYEPKCVYNGTVIRFEWEGNHNVVTLKNRREFDDCDVGDDVDPDYTFVAEYTLNQVKTYYFACGVSIHCQIGGQKIEIQVIERPDGTIPM